jgi:hypothetical protein
VGGLGGERILHRLAYRVWAANEAAMREARIPIERPIEEDAIEGAGELIGHTPEARTNTALLRDALRPLLEQGAAKLPSSVKLVAEGGAERAVNLEIDRDALASAIEGWLSEGVTAFKASLDEALTKIGRDPDPYDGLRVIVGGRMGMHPFFAQELAKALPSSVQVHRFKEPDKTNLATPTVKTSTALGVLGMKYDRIGAVLRAENRDAFRFRVGRNRHGQLPDVLDPTVEYDAWREVGACSKPDVDVLFMSADDDGEVAADDPRVKKATCALGADAVGQRLYFRAVGPIKVEVSVGPSGGEPAKGAPLWPVDLKTGEAKSAS